MSDRNLQGNWTNFEKKDACQRKLERGKEKNKERSNIKRKKKFFLSFFLKRRYAAIAVITALPHPKRLKFVPVKKYLLQSDTLIWSKIVNCLS